MVGVGRSLIVLQVAGNASSAAQVVIIVDMAIRTLPGRNGVSSAERKSHRVVIEGRTEPGISAVTVIAIRGEHCGNVVGIARALEILGVAGIALRRHCLKLAGRCALVAGIAVDCGMSPRQRKAIIVLLDLLYGNLPSQDGMALLAIRPQLTSVNVRVAVLATLPHVGEYRLDVALRAGDCAMHAAQRISGLIVIEFRNGTNRPPGCRRVAVLAWHIQVPVRTVGSSSILRLRARSNANQYNQQTYPIVHAPHA